MCSWEYCSDCVAIHLAMSFNWLLRRCTNESICCLVAEVFLFCCCSGCCPCTVAAVGLPSRVAWMPARRSAAAKISFVCCWLLLFKTAVVVLLSGRKSVLIVAGKRPGQCSVTLSNAQVIIAVLGAFGSSLLRLALPLAGGEEELDVSPRCTRSMLLSLRDLLKSSYLSIAVCTAGGAGTFCMIHVDAPKMMSIQNSPGAEASLILVCASSNSM